MREVLARTVILFRLGVPIMKYQGLDVTEKENGRLFYFSSWFRKHGGSLMRKGKRPCGDIMRR